jgi:hypothetical protein
MHLIQRNLPKLWEEGVRLKGWRQSPSRALCALCVEWLAVTRQTKQSHSTIALFASHVAYHKSGDDDWGVHTEARGNTFPFAEVWPRMPVTEP